MLCAEWAAKESRVVVRRTFVSGHGVAPADAASIASVYEGGFRRFLAGAYAVVGDPEVARDVVQDAFARALRERHRFRGEGSLEAWLWRIVVNVARDTARRSRYAALTAEQLTEIASLNAGSPQQSDLLTRLRELPELQRLAVFFHYFADLPYEEVARLLDIKPGTVGASLNAARETLRHRIKEAYE